MRRVSVRRGAALLTLLAVLAVSPAVFADDTFPPAPPEAKIGPPIGATCTPLSIWELVLLGIQLYAKIGPPIG